MQDMIERAIVLKRRLGDAARAPQSGVNLMWPPAGADYLAAEHMLGEILAALNAAHLKKEVAEVALHDHQEAETRCQQLIEENTALHAHHRLCECPVDGDGTDCTFRQSNAEARAEVAKLQQEKDQLADAITPAHAKDWGVRDLAMLARAHRDDSNTVDDHVRDDDRVDYDAVHLARQQRVTALTEQLQALETQWRVRQERHNRQGEHGTALRWQVAADELASLIAERRH